MGNKSGEPFRASKPPTKSSSTPTSKAVRGYRPRTPDPDTDVLSHTTTAFSSSSSINSNASSNNSSASSVVSPIKDSIRSIGPLQQRTFGADGYQKNKIESASKSTTSSSSLLKPSLADQPPLSGISSFLRVPVDVLNYLLLFLPPPSLARFSGLNKEWRTLLDKPLLWYIRCIKEPEFEYEGDDEMFYAGTVSIFCWYQEPFIDPSTLARREGKVPARSDGLTWKQFYKNQQTEMLICTNCGSKFRLFTNSLTACRGTRAHEYDVQSTLWRRQYDRYKKNLADVYDTMKMEADVMRAPETITISPIKIVPPSFNRQDSQETEDDNDW